MSRLPSLYVELGKQNRIDFGHLRYSGRWPEHPLRKGREEVSRCPGIECPNAGLEHHLLTGDDRLAWLIRHEQRTTAPRFWMLEEVMI